MLVLPRSTTTLVIAAVGAFALSGCGGTQAVKPRAIAFEPRIVGCSEIPTECTSAPATQIRELREAHNHLCTEDKPNVLVKADGALVLRRQVAVRRPDRHRRLDPERGASTRAGRGRQFQGRRSSGRKDRLSGLPSNRRGREPRPRVRPHPRRRASAASGDRTRAGRLAGTDAVVQPPSQLPAARSRGLPRPAAPRTEASTCLQGTN